MKTTLLSFVATLLFSCASPTENKAELEQEQLLIEEPVVIENEEKMTPVEEQEEELSYYQKARLKHPKKDILPQGVVLKNTEEVFDHTILSFEGILKTTSNWFLCKYMRYEGEIEDEFYITFDYNGNQLDAVLVSTLAIDLEGSVSFVNDSIFVAIQRIDEVELNDDGDLTVLSTKTDTIDYTITPQGEILKQEKQ